VWGRGGGRRGGTAGLLTRRFHRLELIEPFRRTILRRRLSPRRQLRKLQQMYGEWAGLLEGLPRDLTAVLEQMREGTLDVHLQHRRLQPSGNRLGLGGGESAPVGGAGGAGGPRGAAALGGQSGVGGGGGAGGVVFS